MRKIIYFPCLIKLLELQSWRLIFPNRLAISKKNNHLKTGIADNKILLPVLASLYRMVSVKTELPACLPGCHFTSINTAKVLIFASHDSHPASNSLRGKSCRKNPEELQNFPHYVAHSY